MPLITPNARARDVMLSKSIVVRMYTGDQQGRTDALEDRVAEDQQPETGRHRTQQGADPVQDESDREASLATPLVGQLAGRDHEAAITSRKIVMAV